MSSKRAWFGLAAILLASPAAAQTAWNNGTFIDGQALHALDLNRNNAWLLAHSGGGGGGGSIPTADLLGGSGIGFIGRAVGSGLLLSGNVLSLAPPFNAAATNGQLLIGNGSGFSVSTLTAGANVTVTNTSGHITIAAAVAPAGTSGQVQYNNAGAFGALTDTQLTTHVNVFTSSLSGAAPASGGGTANFLRADGTWSAPPSANPFPITPAGSTQSVGQITVSGANSGMAVVPNGVGAFMLSIPDGTTTGGNARGNYAIDLQTARSSATQVASGSTTIVIGQSNTASDTNAVAIGVGNVSSQPNAASIGSANVSHGSNSFTAGYNNTANGRGSVVMGETNTGNGLFSVVSGVNGDDRGTSSASVFSGPNYRAQTEIYLFQGNTSGASPIVLTTDGNGASNTNVGTLGPNSAETFTVELTVNDRGNGACVYTMGPGLLWRGAGNVTMGTGNPVFLLGPVAGTSTACNMITVPTVTADTTHQGYAITVTPNAGNTSLLVVTAKVVATWAY